MIGTSTTVNPPVTNVDNCNDSKCESGVRASCLPCSEFSARSVIGLNWYISYSHKPEEPIEIANLRTVPMTEVRRNANYAEYTEKVDWGSQTKVIVGSHGNQVKVTEVYPKYHYTFNSLTDANYCFTGLTM